MPTGDKTNPIMYSPENPRAKQPVGEFMMPMAFHQLDKIEHLNQVSVNAIRHKQKIASFPHIG